MPTETARSSDQVKHLEFIQSTISRISGNSFLIKGWSLSIAAALLAFSAKEYKWRIAAVAVLPLVAFWLLDAYFLRHERLYRLLYDEARLPESTVETFSMNVACYRDSESLIRSIFSTTLSLYYGGLIVGLSLTTTFIAISKP